LKGESAFQAVQDKCKMIGIKNGEYRVGVINENLTINLKLWGIKKAQPANANWAS